MRTPVPTKTTHSPKASEVQRDWWIIDADGLVLGRVAVEAARLLRGKHKATFAPHLDTGDHVIIINAAKARLTGKKLDDKIWWRHSGYPGSLRRIHYGKLMDEHPEKAMEKAIRGMLPHNRLGRQMFRKLKVYSASDHPHEAQQPKSWKAS
jgi:large subunit ribosomal protein L13